MTDPAPTPLHLEIRGMSCGHCVGAVERALAAVPGARVHDVAIGLARLTLDAATPPAAAVAAVRDAGYDARVADAAVAAVAADAAVAAPAAASCCASGRA